jgi:phosphinothricin acetyltransferase
MKKIRSAKLTDAIDLLEIYKPYISNTPITFDLVMPSLEEFQEKLKVVTAKFPWIVYEINGEIVGYAYANTFRTKCAYEWSLESTVYVKEGKHGLGIGKQLYETLFQLLRAQGVINLFAGITLPNAASIKLHENCGFVPVGVYKKIGYKLNQWWDVGWWQLELQQIEQPKSLLLPNCTYEETF